MTDEAPVPIAAVPDEGISPLPAGGSVAEHGPLERLLRVPLFYKILVANAGIAVLGAVLGTVITRDFLDRHASGESTLALILLLALGGVVVTVLVNAFILRLALTPLAQLETTAGRVHDGDLDARVPPSALADREMVRLTRTFNSMLDHLEAYRQRLRDIAARALDAEEEERKRISRELHDDTAQSLAALMIQLRLARTMTDAAERDRLLESIRGEVADAIERLRRFARGLRPPALDDLGLVPALEMHVRTLLETTSVEVVLAADEVDGRLGRQAELALYRILQEALANAIRHARAERVTVEIHAEDDHVEATVSDDGRGFVVEDMLHGERPGLGLFGMQERAAYVGGSITIDSEPGVGTTVRAEIPVPRKPAGEALSL